MEQHIDGRFSRIQRDVLKLVARFSSHNPFLIGENIMSIATGVIGDEEINCLQRYEIGMKSIANTIVSNFKDNVQKKKIK